jgi:hypothetical protein
MVVVKKELEVVVVTMTQVQILVAKLLLNMGFARFFY